MGVEMDKIDFHFIFKKFNYFHNKRKQNLVISQFHQLS